MSKRIASGSFDIFLFLHSLISKWSSATILRLLANQSGPRTRKSLATPGWNMQACGRSVARLGKQDIDRDIAAGFEITGADTALVMGNLDDLAIDDRNVAARQISLDIGRNAMAIGEDHQLVGPIPEQLGGCR